MNFAPTTFVICSTLVGALEAQPISVEQLASRSGCLRCHSSDGTGKGPAFRAVAARYTEQDGADEALLRTVKNGGRGHWPKVARGAAMPGFSDRLSDAEIGRLATWAAGGHDLKVMTTGLGTGRVTSAPTGIDCGDVCVETFSAGTVVKLTATPTAGSVFVRWEGDGEGATDPTLEVTIDQARSVRPVFDLSEPISEMTGFDPDDLAEYLEANAHVDSPARFVKSLPAEYKLNWILMTRSESLQTGTARFPRLLLPSVDAERVFTVGLAEHPSYPGSHPNAIEYMQWDEAESNFRFHEIVLAPIPRMGEVPARVRGVSKDDAKCSKCHSTRNVLNRSPFPGTDGTPPRTLKVKNKPNWDPYDSWGGMLAFNRDRIYQGSVEAAAFRRLLNPWTWQSEPEIRAVVEQLELQPRGILAKDRIWREVGGQHDGHVHFYFDPEDERPVLIERSPSGQTGSSSYEFNGRPGTGSATAFVRDPSDAFVTLQHSAIPLSDEGRGVRLFDALGGNAGDLNQKRIADEVVNHRIATGNVPIDVRPIALAISKGYLRIDTAANKVVSTPSLAVDLGFFDARNGMQINELVADTRFRAERIPRRKADIQRLTLDRAGDEYVSGPPVNGLIHQFGAMTEEGTDTSLRRIRQEVFRRAIDAGDPDNSEMGGVFVDRETYDINTETVALYRYFLEPLGVSVDKWSMGVRGRSRSYAFADVFFGYTDALESAMARSLSTEPNPIDPNDPAQVIDAVNASLASLPQAGDVPTFTDLQRIFNKGCIECHGGLGYPPYRALFLDLSENESPPNTVPPLPSPRLERSLARTRAYTTSDPATSLLYLRLVMSGEHCPGGMMPCGGPSLSKVDIETIRRWIVGGRPSATGSFHINTVNGGRYSFHGAGEFVLLRGSGIEIQARLTGLDGVSPTVDLLTGLTERISVNTAVALRIGRQRVTYQPGLDGAHDPRGLVLRVDGEPTELGVEGIALDAGGRIMPTSAPGGLQIEAPGGTVVVVTPGWWPAYRLWYLDVRLRHARGTEGLLGAIPPGAFLPSLPNGKSSGPRLDGLDERYEQLYDKFGRAWLVQTKTSLFDYAPGSSTEKFRIEGWPRGGEGRRPIERTKPLPLAVARLHGRSISAEWQTLAIRDVMAGGEPALARTYLAADQVMRNRQPSPPELVAPEDFSKVTDDAVQFTWKRSEDADGDVVTYRHYVWPVDAAPNANEAVPVTAANAEMSASEISRLVSGFESGDAYFWKVIADDGNGGVVESRTWRFEVK